MDAIQQIGAFAGLGAFFGLAVLAFLYFAQARHVRDLEEKATYVPEELDLPATTSAPAPVPATGDEEAEEAEGAAEPAAPPPPRTEAEAARQVQIAHAKAERRKRFEERRRTPGGAGGGALRERTGAGAGRNRPEPRAMIVIGLGVAVLALGVVFAAGRVLGGGENSGSSSSGTAASSEGGSTGPPPQVAVLNGTPVPGLAAKIAQDVRSANFNPKPVSNTDTPFDQTEVMFDTAADKNAQTDAQSVASALKIAKIEQMDNDVKRSAGGAGVAVVVGEDRAGT